MDLNRLRILAGLDPITESVELTEADKIKKGAFHKWLGKPEDEKITQADIEKGLNSDDEHVRKMAQFAKNVEESVEDNVMDKASFECPECKHKWTADSKVGDYNKCHECGKVCTPKKAVSESDNKLAHRTPGDNPAPEGNHDSEFPKITFLDKSPPANALVMTQVEFVDDTFEYNKTKMGVDVEEATKVKIPADVMKHVNKRLKELKAAIEDFDNKGYNDKSVKSRAVECLEKIKAHLEAGTQEQFKQAQVYYGTLMSPIFDMFPTQLINFLANPINNKKEKM